MSIAAQWQSDKTSSLVGMVEDLRHLVDRAGREGRSFLELERSVPDSLLTMGYAAAELFLVQQGNGGHHPSGRPPASRFPDSDLLRPRLRAAETFARTTQPEQTASPQHQSPPD